MLNIDFFISRLNEIMVNNNLNSATFAEQIGVQRSSVSHVMSKRNKPSLDFILKIVNSFEEVTLDWLLFDNNLKPSSSSKSDSKFVNSKIDSDLKKSLNVLTNKQSPMEIKTNSDVVQIIQIYKDGSFLTFSPKS
ncbi:MAG: helix-turn-helix transcriptional regulator [Bacteroidota bacterium]|nr:helix-turn-helix transcriptional regulator [Bacteroidota bacterium]MEC8599123.1 helix-turn-helix transcriptional regulator [Bacteroidota bacterium]